MCLRAKTDRCSECQLSYIRFDNIREEDAFSTPKITKIPWSVFACYRGLAALIFIGMFIARWLLAAVHPPSKLHFLVYNSTWAYICLMIYLCLAFSACLFQHFKYKRCHKLLGVETSDGLDSRDIHGHQQIPAPRRTSLILKLTWFFWVISTPACLYTCIGYFLFAFPAYIRSSPGYHLDIWRFNEHLSTVIVIGLELLLFNALPYRLLHSFYVYIYSVLYTAFYLIHFKISEEVVYPFYGDYGKYPLKTSMYTVISFLFIHIMSIAIFVIDKMICCLLKRLSIYNNVCESLSNKDTIQSVIEIS